MDIAIPEHVQQQADEADKLLKKLDDDNQDSQAITDDADQESLGDDIGRTVVNEEPSESEKFSSTPETDWEHKFNVLQGKYNAEVPRLNQDLHYLRNENLKLQEQIDELKQVQVKEDKEPALPDMTDIRDELGDGAADVFAKQQETIAQLSKKLDEMNQQVGDMGKTSQQSAEQLFYSTLEQRVPDWKTINSNQKFLNWLNETDSFSGKTRQLLMNEAASLSDVKRVAMFFSNWKDLNPKSDKQIEKAISPNTNRRSTPVNDKKIYSPADIKRFYDDVAQGKYRNDQDKMKKIDADIMRAQGEGRIEA